MTHQSRHLTSYYLSSVWPDIKESQGSLGRLTQTRKELNQQERSCSCWSFCTTIIPASVLCVLRMDVGRKTNFSPAFRLPRLTASTGCWPRAHRIWGKVGDTLEGKISDVSNLLDTETGEHIPFDRAIFRMVWRRPTDHATKSKNLL